MKNVNENVAFINSYYQSAGGGVKKKYILSGTNDANILLSQLDNTINKFSQTKKLEQQKKDIKTNVDNKLSNIQLKQQAKDINIQKETIKYDRLKNINKELTQKDNELRQSRGYGYSPAEFDKDFNKLSSGFVELLPKDERLDYQKQLDRLYNSKKSVIDQEHLSLVRKEVEQNTNENIAYNVPLIDINNISESLKQITKIRQTGQNAYSINKGENNKIINEKIFSSLISKNINENNTVEQNQKAYQNIYNLINNKNGNVSPNDMNPKLGTMLKSSMKKVIQSAKANSLNNYKQTLLQTDNYLDTVENQKVPSIAINGVREIYNNLIKNISDNNYLTKLEKLEEVDKIKNKSKKLIDYEKVYNQDIVNVMNNTDLNTNQKRIAKKRYESKVSNLFQNKKYNEVGKLVTSVGHFPEKINKEISNNLKSDNLDTIKNTTSQLSVLIHNEPNVYNDLNDEDKKLYSMNKYMIETGNEPIVFNKDLNKVKTSSLDDINDFFNKGGFENLDVKYADGSSEQVSKGIFFDQLEKDKKAFLTMSKQIGLDKTIEIMKEHYKQITSINPSELIVKNNNINNDITEKAINLMLDNTNNSLDLNDYFWEKDKSTDTLVGYKKYIDSFNGEDVIRINRTGAKQVFHNISKYEKYVQFKGTNQDNKEVKKILNKIKYKKISSKLKSVINR